MLDFLGNDRYILSYDKVCGRKIFKENSYKQGYGKDFLEDDLKRFILNVILDSGYFRREIPDQNMAAIHIRNGDYLLPRNYQFNCFDRRDYVAKACEAVKINHPDIDTLNIYSNDNELNFRLYDNIFKKFFGRISYVTGTTVIQDFVGLSLTKTKILFNSTFSFWSSFVSNVVFQDSERNIFCPDRYIAKISEKNEFCDVIPISFECNPRWNFIKIFRKARLGGRQVLPHRRFREGRRIHSLRDGSDT